MNKKLLTRTPFGPVGIIWIEANLKPKIVRVLLTKPELSAEDQVTQHYPNSRTSSCSEINDIAARILDYLEGEEIEFSLDLAHLDLCSDFQQRVLRVEHRIPRGSVSSYQLIASQLGKWKGGRAVRNALANNPFPIIVPCHRAIRSDRHLGGYQGGIEMKRTLLKREGITFDDIGRVEFQQFYYEN